MGSQKVEVGQRITCRIEGTGSKGDPYTRVSGFVVFIRGFPNGETGQTIDIEIIEVRERCAFGKKV